MRLVTAEGGVLTEILDGTYPIWGEGLSRDAYEAVESRPDRDGLGARQPAPGRPGGRRPGAREREAIRPRGADRRAADSGPRHRRGLHADPSLRGQGHAAALIDAMIADASRTRLRARVALLGNRRRLLREARLQRDRAASCRRSRSCRKPGAPAALVRAGEPTDFVAIAEMSARGRHGAAFALDRSSHFIAFMLARRRLLAGLGPAGLRSVEFFVDGRSVSRGRVRRDLTRTARRVPRRLRRSRSDRRAHRRDAAGARRARAGRSAAAFSCVDSAWSRAAAVACDLRRACGRDHDGAIAGRRSGDRRESNRLPPSRRLLE